jgi:pimeloyl-ACP methyl ester carboxylesterase
MIALLLRTILAVQFAAGMLLGWWLVDTGFGPDRAAARFAIGLALPFLLHPFVIALDFAITQCARSPVPRMARLSLTAALWTYLGEVAASVRSFSWAHPFCSRFAVPPPASPVQGKPILFIHGYFCNRALWLPLMREAARRGFRTAAVTLEPPFALIDTYTETIERALDALLEEAQAEQAIIVGHSMGGIAARAWLRRYGELRVARLITLGSPHRGTVMAAFGHGGNVAQMRQDSAWLAALAADESLALRRKMTCVFSYHDNIIAPQLSATLEGTTLQPLSGRGHVRLVYDRVVWDIILSEALTPDAPSQAPPQAPLPLPATSSVYANRRSLRGDADLSA